MTERYLQPGESLAMVQAGNRRYPVFTESRCSTCVSPHRQWIEAELVRGTSYTGISRNLAAFPHGPARVASVQSISNHVKNGHMPIPDDVRREIIESRARELGRSIEESRQPLADHVTVARLMVQSGMDALSDGTMEISAGDTLKAAAFLRQVEKESDSEDNAEVYSQALMVYLEVAKQFIPMERQAAYARALHSNPILRALYQQQQAAQIEEAMGDLEIEEAEVEEDVSAEVEEEPENNSAPPPEDW